MTHLTAGGDIALCWKCVPHPLESKPKSQPIVSQLCHVSGGLGCFPHQIQSSPCLPWWTNFSRSPTGGTVPSGKTEIFQAAAVSDSECIFAHSTNQLTELQETECLEHSGLNSWIHNQNKNYFMLPSRPQYARLAAAVGSRGLIWWRTMSAQHFYAQQAVGRHTARPALRTGTATGSQMEGQGGRAC